jgi:hypothetical protein
VEQGKSLWDYFNGWLNDRFRELRAALPDFPNPLRDWKWHWPEWLPQALSWFGWILVAAFGLAATLVLLRALGVRGSPAVRRAIDALESADSRAAPSARLSFADLDAAPVAQRPRILLTMVLGALRAANRLVADAALSHRQLGSAVREISLDQRAAVELIARLAERATYSQFVPNDIELAEAVGTCRELIRGVSG